MKSAKLFVIPAVVAAMCLFSCKENGDDTKKTNVDETAYEVNPTLSFYDFYVLAQDF